MTNIEQYINNYGNCFPSSTINTDQGINIPKRCSRHLLIDKYLSEYNTEQEKRLVMQNILLMDSIPKENSNRLVNSGTVYKVMREGKLGRDQLTELFNYLQRTKADKSELFSKDYRELTNTPNFIQQQDLENYYDKNEIDNIIQNISLDNIDLSGYATQEYVQNQINNLIDGAPEALNTLKKITDKLSADGDIVNQILNQINEKADKSDIEILDIDTNGHEYVDLGLPSGTLWATMNVGATSETDYGNYYQYGKGANQYQNTYSQSDYSGLESPLDLSVDTARQEWGGNWCTPTKDQMQELYNYTRHQWVNNYKGTGIKGVMFTRNNVSLFIPAGGFFGPNISLTGKNNKGHYLTSSFNTNNPQYIWYLNFSYTGIGIENNLMRRVGCSVRPVIKPSNISLKDKVLQLEQNLAIVATTGSYNDLLDLPTNISSFTNDIGYLTSHQDISGKAENSDLQQTNELIQQLQNRIQQLESKQENIKHEILTQEMYDNLQQYDPYTVYFIVEQLPPTPIDKNYWTFGDTFPVILAGDWKFGDSFPIILAGNWKFGDNFPIILSDPEIEYVEIAGVKWATKNLGAESVTDPGLYFQWGDTKGYSIDQVNNGYKQFNKQDYKWEVSDNYIKYNNIDGKTILDSEDDAVTAIYGKNWSTPTIEDFELLLNSTNYETVINYQNSNMNGVLFTDKLDNSKQLFFPMCGVISSGNNINLRFVYLSSSYKINSLIYALIGEFDPLIGIIINSDKNTSVNTRWYGSPVRGISKKNIIDN